MIWHHIEKGHGRPLILLHGIGMNSDAWVPVLDRLAVQRRGIAFDIPGFGRAPGIADQEPNAGAMVESLGQSLHQMGITEPVDVVGNSLGGYIALEAAAQGLARAVVGISPAGLWRDKGPAHIEPMFNVMRGFYRALPGLADRALATGIGRTLLLSGAVAARGWKMPARDAVQAARAFSQSHHFESVFEAFRPPFQSGDRISVPCTVAFGDLDMVFPVGTRDRNRVPSHTHWVRLPGCGHVPMWDAPDLVAHVILQGTH